MPNPGVAEAEPVQNPVVTARLTKGTPTPVRIKDVATPGKIIGETAPHSTFIVRLNFGLAGNESESYVPDMPDLFVTERSRTHRKKNAQFRDCQRENLPLVTITPGRNHALVEIDMFPTDKNLDEPTIREIDAVFAKHTASKHIKVSAIQCLADRVPRAVAASVATQLFQIAAAAMPRLPLVGTPT
jgi:hypothetical protein